MTQIWDCTDARLSLGVYVLGAIDPAERALVDTHLVTCQVIGRTPFDADAYQAAHAGPNGVPGGIDPTPFATGPMEPPDPTERGFKDTIRVNPGYFTTVRAKYELPDGVTTPQTYVYHCHILEHEDNDMMRPFTVTA